MQRHTHRCWRSCLPSCGWRGPKLLPRRALASSGHLASHFANLHRSFLWDHTTCGKRKHSHAYRQTGSQDSQETDTGAGGRGAKVSLTFRASAGGEMSLSRWVSKASPEAPPWSIPAEAPQTCTHSSKIAYTFVRMVLEQEQGEQGMNKDRHARAPGPPTHSHHPLHSILFLDNYL